MVNSAAVNATAVNAAAGGVLELSFTCTQQVALQLRASATQQVQALTLTVACRATQQVSLRVTLALTCTQQVAPLQVQPAMTATQQVAAAAGVLTLTATQQVQAPGVLAPAATQRPAVVALLAGMDISARLTDAVEVDREAGQAASAALSFLPLGGAVDLAQWIGATLTIDLSDGSGPVRVFSGWVTDAQYDMLRRLTVLQASDDLQRALDALPREVIDAVTPGAMWSAAAADESATGWAYAQDRMATLPADLDRDRWGALRVTPWAAAAVADWTFDAGAIVDESLRVEPGRWRELINQIDITAEVRYTRRLHREGTLRWEFAAYGNYAKAIKAGVKEGLEGPDNGNATRAVLAWLGDALVQENATRNLVYRHHMAVAALATAPSTEFDARRAALEEEYAFRLGWHYLYNPLGKFLFHVSQPEWPKYAARIHDLDGYIRLVRLQFELKRGRVRSG